MLHNNRPTGNQHVYHYPKVILSHMLILQHWKTTGYCGYEMMKRCMAIFNEELGELTFAILARSVLGDHCKNNFEHMDRLFRLLPVYRDVKKDVVQDAGRSDSLSWRHKIDVNGDEVKSCVLWLRQTIRQLQNSSYKSYDGSMAGYSNSINGAAHKVNPSNGPVFMSKADLDKYVSNVVDIVRNDMSSNFLYKYRHIWPECVNDELVDFSDEVIVNVPNQQENKVNRELVDDDDGDKLADNDEDDDEDHAEVDDVDDEGDDEQEEEPSEVDDDDLLDHPYQSRGWQAWGRVNQENQMIGKRPRKQVVRYNYVARRKGASWPEPEFKS